MLIWPEFLLKIFEIAQSKNINDPLIYTESLLALKAVWLFMVIDGIVWIISGIFKAAGDTLFIMYTNPTCAFLFGFIPGIILIEYNLISAGQQWLLMCNYAIVNVLVFLFRYRSNKWKKMDLSKETSLT
jgi:MATE family multidrug resistance protein